MALAVLVDFYLQTVVGGVVLAGQTPALECRVEIDGRYHGKEQHASHIHQYRFQFQFH